jgi:transcriptional regulator with XRE-family HTH domain
MSKNTPSLSVFPPAAAQALRALGENLAIARLRRRESQREWAGRLGCSVPTLIRLERGDPAVGVGLYVTALWLIGRANGLCDLAEPAEDRGALEDDVREALRRRAVRSAASAQAYLARRRPKEVAG